MSYFRRNEIGVLLLRRRQAVSRRVIWRLQRLAADYWLTHRLNCEAVNLAGHHCSPASSPGLQQAALAPSRLSMTSLALIPSRRGLF